MTLFFVADTHFGHEKVIQYSNRPFTSLIDMDESLIVNWNARVTARDEVWHLGDFSFSKEPALYRRRLHGNIHLVLGNHDQRRMSKYDMDSLFASVHEVYYLRREGLRFWLSHYAHRTWPQSGHGSFHLYGHSHGDMPGIGRSMDVGVDANNYAPISMEEVIAKLKDCGPTAHHLPREITHETHL